jgi:hypothetical protein
MKSVSSEVVAVDSGEIEWERVGRHRGSGLAVKAFPFRHDGNGRNFWLSIGTIHDGYTSPRHRHNFDQIRFMLEGSTNLGDWQLGQGECGYFPESVPYGPQIQKGDAQILTLQFSGASGAYFLTPEELKKTVAGLRESDPAFGEGGKGKGADGKTRDSYDVVYETFTGRPIEFAAPRYRDVVVMKPQNFSWVKSAGSPIEMKSLGRFTEVGLEVAMARINGAADLGVQTNAQTEVWFLTDGSVTLNSRTFPRHSAFMLTAPERPQQVVTNAPAEFLVIRMPRASTA